MAFISGTGIDLNVIPSAGGGGYAIAQAAGGHTDLAVTHVAAAKPQIEAGNLRFLAVIGDERDPNYPDVPTLKEVGYNVGWESFGTVMGPPKMPQYAVDKLRNAFRIAATDPQYHKFLVSKFANPFYTPHDKIIPYADERLKTVREIMKKAGVLKEK
jgi:tripartite-type tricarboxylate transporter receptor subunit TctC